MATTATVPNAGAAGAAGNSGGTPGGGAGVGGSSSAANPSQQPGGAGQGSGQGDSSAASSQQGAGSPTAAATQQEPLSTEQVIKKTFEDRLKFDDKGNITNAEEAVEHPLVEEKKADANTEAAAAASEQKTETAEGAATETAETAENPYESTEGIAAKDLSARINENPALKAELEKSPELRNQLYANARLAARVTEYEKVFMSPHEAQIAAEAHGSYSMLQGLLNQVDPAQPDTASAFVRAMVEQTYLRDEDGNILKNAQGQPRSSGAVGRLFKSKFGERVALDMQGLQQQLEQARAKGDDDAVENISNDMAAMERAAERLGLRAPSGADEGDTVPEHIRREKAALAEQKKQLDEREQTQRQQQQEQFDEGLAVATQEIFDSEIQSFLKNATGLDDHNRATVMRNVKLALQEHLNKNGYYADEYDRAASRGNGAKTKQALVAINLKYMRAALQKGVANKALTDAGAHLAWQQKRAEETQAARETASRGETRTALGIAKPASAMNTTQLRQQIVTEWQAAHNGEMPTQQQILHEQLTRGFAAAAQR